MSSTCIDGLEAPIELSNLTVDLDSALRATCAGFTSIGCAREVNQDRLVLEHDRGLGVLLFGVFDGHGQMGEVAAEVLRHSLAPFLFAALRSGQSMGSALSSSIGKANDLLLYISEEQRTLIGSKGRPEALFEFGTTCCVCVVRGPSIWVANVGDSRALYICMNSP